MRAPRRSRLRGALIVDKPLVCGREITRPLVFALFLNSAWSSHCAHQARLWHSLLHWAYFGLFRAQRAAFVRPAVGGPVFRRCALRVLAPPAASRPPTASDRDGNAFLPQTQAVCSAKNARNDVHAVISDLNLVSSDTLSMLCAPRRSRPRGALLSPSPKARNEIPCG